MDINWLKQDIFYYQRTKYDGKLCFHNLLISSAKSLLLVLLDFWSPRHNRGYPFPEEDIGAALSLFQTGWVSFDTPLAVSQEDFLITVIDTPLAVSQEDFLITVIDTF